MTTRIKTVSLACLLVAVACWFCSGTVFANDDFSRDDFNRIVRHIEVHYHVHRNHSFAVAFAGLIVNFWHFAGVKGLRAAIFDDQEFLRTAADTHFDQVVQQAAGSGWQPVLASYSRRSGTHDYMYFKASGKDICLLLVNLEPSEAEVMEIKLDPEAFRKFVDDPHPFGKQFGAD